MKRGKCGLCSGPNELLVAHRKGDNADVCVECLAQGVIRPHGLVEWPTINVKHDYEGYFEKFVRNALLNKLCNGGELKHKVVNINALPWRPYGVACQANNGTLDLDFYSAVRLGHGKMFANDNERKAFVELL